MDIREGMIQFRLLALNLNYSWFSPSPSHLKKGFHDLMENLDNWGALLVVVVTQAL